MTQRRRRTPMTARPDRRPSPVTVTNPLASVDERVAAEVRRVVAGRWDVARVDVVSRTHVEVVLPNR